MNKGFLFSIIIIFLFPSLASAEVFYIRPLGGSYGSEDGSSYDNAWDGFNNIAWGSGVGAVGAGDTLYVCGTHNQKLTVGASGTDSGNMVTIRGDCPGDLALIDINDVEAEYNAIHIDGDDYVHIYDIDCTDTYQNVVYITSGAQHNKIENCEISYGGGNCIYIAGSNTAYNTVTNCITHHGGTGAKGGGGGIVVVEGAHDNIVEYCESYSNSEDGIGFAGYPDCSSSTVAGNNNIARHNYLHDNSEDGIDIKGYSGNIIEYNRIENNAENGIVLWGISKNNIVRYNWIDEGGTTRALELWVQCTQDTTGGHEIYGNIIYGGVVQAMGNGPYANPILFYNNVVYGKYEDGRAIALYEGPYIMKNNIF
jgi:parallel beta-helix repeat protein